MSARAPARPSRAAAPGGTAAREAHPSRPAAELPRAAAAVERLLAASGLHRLPPEGWALYGGALRAVWTGEPASRVRVAVLDPKLLGPVAALARRHPSLAVAEGVAASPGALLDAADLTIAQVAYHDGRIVHAEPFFEHLAQKLLKLHRVSDPAATLARTYRFVARGFVMPAEDFVRLARAAGVRGPLDARTLARDAGGVLVPG